MPKSASLAALMLLGLATGLVGCDGSSPSSPPATPTGADGAANQATGTTEIVDIWTPAAMGDGAWLRKSLATAGVNPDELDPTFGATAIAFAADFGRTEAVRILLDAGADPNAPNKDRSTPSLGAAFFGRPECLQILLDAGADPTIPNRDGTTTYTALDAPWPITKFIADALEMPLDPELLDAGRAECRRILSEGQ
jgi:hypothetical protein